MAKEGNINMVIEMMKKISARQNEMFERIAKLEKSPEENPQETPGTWVDDIDDINQVREVERKVEKLKQQEEVVHGKDKILFSMGSISIAFKKEYTFSRAKDFRAVTFDRDEKYDYSQAGDLSRAMCEYQPSLELFNQETMHQQLKMLIDEAHENWTYAICWESSYNPLSRLH
ncbi:transcription factor MYC2-like [Fagus crenata]